jgi:hypothetical protein
VAYELTLIRGRIEQRGDLGFGQLLSSHHSCLPGILRPADQPIRARGSIRVLRLRPKVRQTTALLAPCIRSAERPATENVTDSARSGSRPIPLARPPEFVVCPLICEIQAFRYFWPSAIAYIGRSLPEHRSGRSRAYRAPPHETSRRQRGELVPPRIPALRKAMAENDCRPPARQHAWGCHWPRQFGESARSS